MTKQWTDDYHAFCQRDLSGIDYVYVWADGVHVNVRLAVDTLCLLVIVGVRADGTNIELRPPESAHAYRYQLHRLPTAG